MSFGASAVKDMTDRMAEKKSESTAAGGQNAPPKAPPKPQNPVFKMMGKLSLEISLGGIAIANRHRPSALQVPTAVAQLDDLSNSYWILYWRRDV